MKNNEQCINSIFETDWWLNADAEDSWEYIEVIKKNGDHKACEEGAERSHLVEELADVLMYYNDVLLCYGITAEELKAAYTEKFHKNMRRW